MAITTQINGGSIFTAVIPLYLTASTPGLHTVYNSTVDDVFLYSIDGGSFVSSGQASAFSINFTANQIVRLVLWYQNLYSTGAYLNLSFDPNISIWSLPDPTSIQGSLPNLIPTTTTTTGLSQGVSGLIFYQYEDAYRGAIPPSLDVVSYTDTSLPIPQPSGKFTSAKVNYWTDLNAGQFTRPSDTIDWPIVTCVAKLSQTITFFSTIPSQTPVASPFTITPPTSSSGLSVAVTVKSGPATISGNTITLTGTGTVVLAANQEGNTDYNAATEVTTSFAVVKAAQTISSFATISSKTPVDSPFTITPPTSSSGLTVAVTVKSGPATISGNTVTLNGTEGTVVLAANQAGNTDYNAATEVRTSFTVAKLAQTISSLTQTGVLFTTGMSSKTPGASPFTIPIPTSTSGLPVTVTVKSGPATISGNTITLTGTEGTVVLAANQSGNADYNASNELTTSFTVAKLAQTISSFATIPQQMSAFTITAPSSSSGLPVSVSVSSGPVTISGTPGGTYTITPTGNGEVVLVANQQGDSNYSYASGIITLFKAGAIIVNMNVGVRYNQNTAFSGSFSDFLALNNAGKDVVSGLPPGIQYSINNYDGNAAIYNGHFSGIPTTVGTYSVTTPLLKDAVDGYVTFSGNAYYSIVVGKGTASISLSGLNQTYTGSPLTVSCTTTPANLGVAITYNGSSTAPTNATHYTIIATINDANWQGSAVAIMYIQRAPVTINFPQDGLLHSYTGNAIPMEYTTSPEGVSVVLEYRNGLNSVVPTPIHSGTYVVRASSSDSNYTGNATGILIISGEPYYYNNATRDGNLTTLGNWWLDSAHTTPSTSLPTQYDIVYIDGDVNILQPISTTIVSYDTIIIGKYSSNLILNPNNNNYGWGQNVKCNFLEFWNGSGFIYENGFSSSSFGANVSATFHYPCPLPILTIVGASQAFQSPEINYIGYPYGIIQIATDIALQTLWIDQSQHGTALWGSQPANQPNWGMIQSSLSPGVLKEGDDFLFQVAFHSGSSFSDPKITTLSCNIIDPASNSIVLSSSNFIPCIVTNWGNPVFFSYIFYLSIVSDALTECFGSFSKGINETVTLIGEVEWNEVNETRVGPSIFTRRSQNFPITITRSLNQGADFTS